MPTDPPKPLSERIRFHTLLLVTILIWSSCGAWIQHFVPYDERGVFGDMFGAANALFSGIALAGVVYAIFQQREANDALKAQILFEQQKYLEDISPYFEVSGVGPPKHDSWNLSLINTGASTLLIHAAAMPEIDTGTKFKVDALEKRLRISSGDEKKFSIRLNLDPAESMPTQVILQFTYRVRHRRMQSLWRLTPSKGGKLIFVKPIERKRASSSLDQPGTRSRN